MTENSTAKARSFPANPNKRTAANLEATAAFFREAHTIAEFATAQGVEYPAAAERVRMLIASGRYAIVQGKGTRNGKRGAFPVSYQITADIAPAPLPAEVPATPVAE